MPDDHRMRPGRATQAGPGAAVRRAAPWLGILLLTGGFHVLRGASVDAIVFLGVGVLLAADAAATAGRASLDVSPSPRFCRALVEDARPGTRPAPWWLLGVGALVGVVLVLAPRYSALDAVAVGALGILLVPLVWPEPGPGHPDAATPRSRPAPAPALRRAAAPAPAPAPAATPAPALRRAALLWSAVAVVAAGWELSSYFLALPSAAAALAHPALSDLIGPLLDAGPTRAICVALWLVGGFALLRRGGHA